MEFQPLKYIYEASGNPDAYTLLLLHGTGGDEHDLIPIAQHFGKDLNVLSLRGNISENGMPRFFRRIGMGIFDEKDLEFRTREMIHFLKELAAKKKFDVTKIIALGYSNGANIAGASLFLQPDFLAGAILLRPMQPFRYSEIRLSGNHVPVLIASGKNDPTVNRIDTENYVKVLEENKFNVTHFEANAGHNLTSADLDEAVTWYRQAYLSKHSA
ncbi:alpha/beta hydrolase [Flavobacterium sp.]|uniref:alpha/beta hydrolase n=1 Tax=Flavobacterium sp. TaxID=239 RepID=UPI0039E5CBA0